MGRELTQGRVAPPGVVEALDKVETAIFASACVWKRLRSRSSHSSVAKKLSQSALSYASPTEPIEGRTPTSLHRRPNAIDVYSLGSSGRRNSTVLKGFHKPPFCWTLGW